MVAGANRRSSSAMIVAAALDHRGRSVYSYDIAAGLINSLAHRYGCSTQRATEVIAVTVWLDVAGSQSAYRLDGCGVARNGAAQHIRKDLGDVVIEAKRLIITIVLVDFVSGHLAILLAARRSR